MKNSPKTKPATPARTSSASSRRRTSKLTGRGPQRTRPAILQRHPAVEAFEKFQAETPETFEVPPLGLLPAHGRYLANRLEVAFLAGWGAAKSSIANRKS